MRWDVPGEDQAMELETPFDQRVRGRMAGFTEEARAEEMKAVLADLERENRELAQFLDQPLQDRYDVVIIGSGPGGGTLAYALRGTGKSVLVVERGDFLPQEPSNWDTDTVLTRQAYANTEEWLGAEGVLFNPYHYYYVGGLTKLYAATLLRFRAEDFGEIRHEDGISPAWPASYDEMEPYYADAERLYLAHGRAGEDPTEPYRSGPFPYPPAPVPPEVRDLRDRLSRVGLHPFAMPEGIALMSGGRCLYCAFCDSYPCRVLARADPELCCIRPALRSPGVSLMTRAKALRLETDATGKEVVAVVVEQDGQRRRIEAGLFVVSAGAVNSPILLFRSACERHPHGLANSSRTVGRHYMRHDITVLMAQAPEGHVLPQDHFWKTVGFNDFYFSGGADYPYPLGTVQVIGNYHSWMSSLLPEGFGGSDEERSRTAAKMLPIFAVTEDLPRADNRVELTDDDRIRVTYQANNLESHTRLVETMTAKLTDAGYGPITAKPLIRAEQGGGYHHCGTVRMGDDPATSALDRHCKAHDLENLYVVDASCFPSASACNPVLTIVANSLRVADRLKARL
jgi:choline dehydrogenase-like flavoprotein